MTLTTCRHGMRICAAAILGLLASAGAPAAEPPRVAGPGPGSAQLAAGWPKPGPKETVTPRPPIVLSFVSVDAVAITKNTTSLTHFQFKVSNAGPQDAHDVRIWLIYIPALVTGDALAKAYAQQRTYCMKTLKAGETKIWQVVCGSYGLGLYQGEIADQGRLCRGCDRRMYCKYGMMAILPPPGQKFPPGYNTGSSYVPTAPTSPTTCDGILVQKPVLYGIAKDHGFAAMVAPSPW